MSTRKAAGIAFVATCAAVLFAHFSPPRGPYKMFALERHGFGSVEEKQNAYAAKILNFVKTNQLNFEEFQEIAGDQGIACKSLPSSRFNIRCDYLERTAYFSAISHFIIFLNQDEATGEIKDAGVALGGTGL